MNSRLLVFLIPFMIIASSCSTTKKLKPGEQLYIGADVKIKTEKKVRGQKFIQGELEDLLLPKPNKRILRMRIPLAFYQLAGKKNNGFNRFLKEKLGEPPVLYEQVKPDLMIALIENKLTNNGYFQPFLSYKTKISKDTKKVKLVYEAAIKEPYSIKSYVVKDSSILILDIIRNQLEKSVLKVGDQYNLDKLKEERERMDAFLKNEGFFFFNSDFLFFEADTSIGERTIALTLSVKKNTPRQVTTIYKMGEIDIYPDYTLSIDSTNWTPDTIIIDNKNYLSRSNYFKPEVITDAVYLRKYDFYSREKHNLTLSRQMGLGVFKFVNIRFVEDSIWNDQLNAKIYLTPLKKKSIRLEIEGITKSNGNIGPLFSITHRNRNTFRGAELLILNGNAGFETQISGNNKAFNSYILGAEAELNFPRFITPFFKIKNTSSKYIPKTFVKLGYQLNNRVRYYRLNSFATSFGYEWNETDKVKHVLSPIVINYVSLSNKSVEFLDIVRINPLLERSLEEQFIIGSTYSYTINNQYKTELKNHLFFNVTFDVSGNLIRGALGTFTKGKRGEENPFTIFGQPFSQYSKVNFDFRHYYNATLTSKVASRVIIGVGVPYLNSSSLPYIKQYFTGGTNSIRAFRSRTLGPGSYQAPSSTQSNSFFDQAGDVKLELNSEYRFKIYSILKGAFFVDAGNIWLIRENEAVPGGAFKLDKFYKEYAVGTGVGIRADASFFVLRFDFAFPLRKPFLPENDRWVVKDIAFGKKDWRRDNLILNVAIGYPF